MTVNGLGERCGNAPLSSVHVILKDHFNAHTNINENKLNDVSKVVESYSGISIAANQPIVGEKFQPVEAEGDIAARIEKNVTLWLQQNRQ